MRHLKQGRKFGRERGDRKVFLRDLTYQLVMRGRVVTTAARAKELKRVVERLVTYGKRQDVAGLRLLVSKLPKEAAYRMQHDIAPRYVDRKGGYTRVVKHMERRVQDNAEKATIEFV